MENLRAHILTKIMSATLIIAFITLDISWAYPPEDHNTTTQSSSNLATQSGFQQKAITSDGQDFTIEFYSEASFLYSIYHMADYFFESPERNMASYVQHLEIVMARELGEKAIEGIGLSKVRFIDSKEADCYKHSGNENGEGRVVLIPYKKGGIEYIIQVAMKKDPISKNLLGRNMIKPDDKLFNDKYVVKIVYKGYKGIGLYDEGGKGEGPIVSAPIPAPVVPEKQDEAAQDIPPAQDSDITKSGGEGIKSSANPIISTIILIAVAALGSAGVISGIYWLHPYLAAAGIDLSRTVSELSLGLPLLFTGLMRVSDAKGTEGDLYLKEKLTDILQNSLGYPKTKILDDIVNDLEKLFRDKDMDLADIKKGLMSNNPSELLFSVDSLIDWLGERKYFDISRPDSLIRLLISGLNDNNEDIFKTKGYSAREDFPVRDILEAQLIYILLSLADIKVKAYFSKDGPLILVHLDRYRFMFIDRTNKICRRIDISEYYDKEADGSLILKESEWLDKKGLALIEQEIKKDKSMADLTDVELLNLLYPEIQEVNARGSALFGFKPVILYKLGEIYRLLHEDGREAGDEKAYNLLSRSIDLTPCQFCKRLAFMEIAAIFHKRYKESGDELDIKKAFATLELVIYHDPENILAHISLAALSLNTGDFKEAVDLCENAIQLNPDNSYAHFVQGLAFYGLREFDKARSSFNASIRLEPKNPGGYFHLGSTYLELKNPRAADDLFKNYMELRGYDSTSRLNVGLALCEKGDRNKGIMQLRIAVKMTPKLLKLIPDNLMNEVKDSGDAEKPRGFSLDSGAIVAAMAILTIAAPACGLNIPVIAGVIIVAVAGVHHFNHYLSSIGVNLPDMLFNWFSVHSITPSLRGPPAGLIADTTAPLGGFSPLAFASALFFKRPVPADMPEQVEITYGSRKPVKIDINYVPPDKVKEEFRKRNGLFNELLSAVEKEKKKLYVSQVGMVDKKTFIGIIGDPQDKDFEAEIRTLIQNKRIWAFVLKRDMVIDLSGGSVRVYYGKDDMPHPLLERMVKRLLSTIVKAAVSRPTGRVEILDIKKKEAAGLRRKSLALLKLSLALVVFIAAMAGTSALVHYASAIWAYLHGIFSAGPSTGAPMFFMAGMSWFGGYRMSRGGAARFFAKLKSPSVQEKTEILIEIPALLEKFPHLATSENLRLVLEILNGYDLLMSNYALKAIPHFLRKNKGSFTKSNLELVLGMLRDLDPVVRGGALHAITYFIKANKTFATKDNLKIVLEMLNADFNFYYIISGNLPSLEKASRGKPLNIRMKSEIIFLFAGNILALPNFNSENYQFLKTWILKKVKESPNIGLDKIIEKLDEGKLIKSLFEDLPPSNMIETIHILGDVGGLASYKAINGSSVSYEAIKRSSKSTDESNIVKAHGDALAAIWRRLTPAQKEEARPANESAPAQTQGADPAIEEGVRRLFEIIEQGVNNRRTLFIDKANALAALAGGGEIDRNGATSKIKYQITDLIKIIRDTKPDTAISAKDAIEYLENNFDQLEADSIASSLIELVRRTPKEKSQRRLIALCPDWIPGYIQEGSRSQQRKLIASLITEIKPLMNRLNIEFIIENNSDKLEETILNTGIDTANVLLIASQEKVTSLRGIDESTGASIDKLKGAFLVGIDSEELEGPYSDSKDSSGLPDINLLELLSIALEAALGKEPQGKTPAIQSYDYDKGLNRIVLRLERPKVKNYIELYEINNSRKIAMRNA